MGIKIKIIQINGYVLWNKAISNISKNKKRENKILKGPLLKVKSLIFSIAV